MSITIEQYAGIHATSPDWTLEHQKNARKLLNAVNLLMSQSTLEGVNFPINPLTKSQIAGETLGGFRPQSCTIGAPNSAHKEGLAIDLYDPTNAIDDWCETRITDLQSAGIYIEHPSATMGWSHWTIRPPKSGNQIFYP